MDEEKFEEKIFEYRMKSLIAQRTTLVQILIVLIGGITGLFFVENSPLKWFLVATGIFFAIVFVKSFIGTIRELNKILYKKRK